MTTKLTYQDSTGAEKQLELGQDTVYAGRAAECTLALDDALVSRKHAAFVRADGVWFVEDLGSANGTWVGGARLTERRALQADDTVRLGATVIRFVVADTAKQPALGEQEALRLEARRARTECEAFAARVHELALRVKDAEDEREQAQDAAGLARKALDEAREEARAARARDRARADAEIARLQRETARLLGEIADLVRVKDEGWRQANALAVDSEQLRAVIRSQGRLLEEQRVRLVVFEEARRGRMHAA